MRRVVFARVLVVLALGSACSDPPPPPAFVDVIDVQEAFDRIAEGGIQGRWEMVPDGASAHDPDVETYGPTSYAVLLRGDLRAGRFVADGAEVRLLDGVMYTTGRAGPLRGRIETGPFGGTTGTVERDDAIAAQRAWAALCLEAVGYPERTLPPVLTMDVVDVRLLGTSDAAGVEANHYEVDLDVAATGNRWLIDELDPTIELWERDGRVLQLRWWTRFRAGIAGVDLALVRSTLQVSALVGPVEVVAPRPIQEQMGRCPP